jgi:L-alanine-DL-glutamate epimerase-like enolase superfamily enzyme
MSDTSISEIETWLCRVKLPDPIDLGPIIVRERDYLVVRVRTSGGLTSDCVTQVRGSPVDVALSDLLAPKVLGRDAVEIAAITAAVRRSLTAVEFDGVVGRAWSALEICVQGLRAQSVGWPLWKLLGGNARDVPVAIVEGYAVKGESEVEFVDRIVRSAAQGFRLIKIEAGHYRSLEELIRRLVRFRELSPGDTQLVLDLAWSWSMGKENAAHLRTLEGLGIAWIEDMYYRTSVDSYRRLRDSTSIPIACGDEVSRPDDLRRLMDQGALDVVRMDATSIGGFEPVRQLSAKALDLQLRVSYHVSPEVHQHCVFGFESADHIEIFPTNRPFDATHQLIRQNACSRVVNGMLSPPTEPGTGIVLNEEAVARYALRHSRVAC